jgi:dephospho-CoA kinase
MKKVAITGNIAAGKSAAQAYLERLGFLVFDCDVAGHGALRSDLIKKAFAEYDVFGKNGEISRRKMGALVFNDEKLRRKLEKLSHPIVLEKMEAFFEENRAEKLLFVAVPLLFEVGLGEMFDAVIFIDADIDIRKRRLAARDGLTADEVQARTAAQLPTKEKILRSDFVITNNGSLGELYQQLDIVIPGLTRNPDLSRIDSGSSPE